MKNYESVHQWTSTLKADKALNEITALKEKYQWLRCDESMEFITRMHTDLPKIVNIIKLQEKQLAIQSAIIHHHHLADRAIIDAIKVKFNITTEDE